MEGQRWGGAWGQREGKGGDNEVSEGEGARDGKGA